jgi:hypothetical protein
MRKRKYAASATVLRLLDKNTHDRTEQSTGANGALHMAPACYGGEPMVNWNLPLLQLFFFSLTKRTRTRSPAGHCCQHQCS